MKKQSKVLTFIMVVVGIIVLCFYIWFMMNPDVRYPIFFSVIGVGACICAICGYKILRMYNIP